MLSTLSLPTEHSPYAGLLLKARTVTVTTRFCCALVASLPQTASRQAPGMPGRGAVVPPPSITSNPGVTIILGNISRSYGWGHVSPAKVKRCHQTSPAPSQALRSTLDCRPTAAHLAIKLLPAAAWISTAWFCETGEGRGG